MPFTSTRTVPVASLGFTSTVIIASSPSRIVETLAEISESHLGIVPVAFTSAGVWFPSPEYITVMLWTPGVALDLVRFTIAFPPTSSSAGIVSFPILTVTLPVALSGTMTVTVPSPLSITLMSPGLVSFGDTTSSVVVDLPEYLSSPL